jgi:hypothetical protein
MISISKTILGLLACVLLTGMESTFAINVVWDAEGGEDRDWGTAMNWNLDVEPAITDVVFIGNSYTAVVTTADRVASNVFVGFVAATGTLLQTGGSLTVNNFVLGSATNTEGSYTLSDGSLTVGVRMVVGASGAATAIVDGVNASITIGENLHVGMSNNNNRAVFRQNAGTVSVGASVLLGNGSANTAVEGRYVMTGGTLSVSNQILLGSFIANATGRLDVTGGSVNSGNILVGRNGCGIMTVGGSATVNVINANLFVGEISSHSNTLEVYGNSSVLINGGLFATYSGAGSKAFIKIKDNSQVVCSGGVMIGRLGSHTGQVEMTGGRLVTTNGSLTIGNGGAGSMYISGTATVDLNSANGDLIVGSSSVGVSNILEISGSGAIEVQDEFLMCTSADGVRSHVKMSENSKINVGRNLLAGQRAGSYAEIAMTGGELTVTSVCYIGNASNAIGNLMISDGIFTTRAVMALGRAGASTGIVTMAGGTWSVGGNLEVGNTGYGFITMSGGTLTTVGPLLIPHSGPGGVFEVIGSAPSITVGNGTTQDLIINSNGHLKVTFSGGAIATILVQDDIIISTNVSALSIDAIGAVPNGTYVIATSLNSSVVSGSFVATNWLGGLAGTVSYTNRCIEVTITGAAVSPYDTWALSYGLTGDDASPTNDPDSDTWYNQLEYSFGGNPTNDNDVGVFPSWALKSTGMLEVVYRRRLDAASRGLTYQVQAESNLIGAAWSTNGTEEVGSGTIDASFESVTNRINVGNTTHGRVEIGLEQ